MNKFLTIAIKLWELGYSPVPVRADGSKAPAVNTWQKFQHTQIPRDLVVELFSKPGICGIGIVCGNGSLGLVMFEFEGRAVAAGLQKQFFAELKAINPGLARRLRQWAEWTPSGGLHYYFRCADPAGSGPLAKDSEGKTLIETKGQGGFTIVAPSCGTTHPTGKEWTERRGGPEDCPTLTPEEQNVVLNLARTYGHVPEVDTEPAPTLNTNYTVTPRNNSTIDELIAEFNRQHTWHEILAGTFEFVSGPDNNGIHRLRFIGQTGQTGATINATGNDTLIVWSSTAAGKGWAIETPGGKKPSYDKFSAWVHINHHGDRMAGLKAIGLEDLPDLDAEGGKIADSIAESIKESETEVAEAKAARRTLELMAPLVLAPLWFAGLYRWPVHWPDVVPLEPEPEPPAFPIDVLPKWMRGHVEHVAEQIQVPVDLPATTALGSLVSILTGRCKVQITHFWTEPVNLFQVVAMRSGSGKSPAVNQTVDWVYDLEAALEAASAESVRQHEEIVRICQDELQRARKAAASGKQEEGAKSVHDLRNELETAKQNLEDARSPRLVVQDATPEGLINVLAHNTGVSIISPEAELFDMVTRGKSSERASLDIYLKGFSGEPYIKDRKGSNEHGPEAVRIPHANLSVCCTVQPAVLDKLCTDELLANRGFAQRFMYACPADMVGHRDIDAQFTSSQAAKDARDAYEGKCRDFAKDWINTGNLVCTFSKEAVEAVKQFKASLEPRLRHTADLANLAEWVSKLMSSVVRMAAVLHLIHGKGTGTEISKATVDQAIKIGNYWLQNAIIILAYRGDLHRQQTHHMLDWIKSRHPDSGLLISTAEFAKAKDGTGNRVARTRTLNLWDARDYIPALRTLEEHGYIVFEDEHWADKLGTKGSSKEFRLNPNIPVETKAE